MEHVDTSPLRAELAYFDANRAELVARYLGKFVLVKDDDLAGTFDSAQAAYEAGVAKFGAVPFLVRQVLPADPETHAPALFTGLVSLER